MGGISIIYGRATILGSVGVLPCRDSARVDERRGDGAVLDPGRQFVEGDEAGGDLALVDLAEDRLKLLEDGDELGAGCDRLVNGLRHVHKSLLRSSASFSLLQPV